MAIFQWIYHPLSRFLPSHQEFQEIFCCKQSPLWKVRSQASQRCDLMILFLWLWPTRPGVMLSRKPRLSCCKWVAAQNRWDHRYVRTEKESYYSQKVTNLPSFNPGRRLLNQYPSDSGMEHHQINIVYIFSTLLDILMPSLPPLGANRLQTVMPMPFNCLADN